MITWTDITEFKAQNPVITVGSFDGLHKGHLEVISQLKREAERVNGQSVVFTFWPHPSNILQPDKPLWLLNTIPEKIRLFEKAGIDHLVLHPFTKDFSGMPYEQFVSEILLSKLNLHTLLVGYDNRMGHNREGDTHQLKKLGHKHGFKLVTISEVQVNNGHLSSTRIRQLLAQGNVFEASQLLGYPYMVSGTVVRGAAIGAKAGFPNR
jgi:riboflavin kinase / FMN adenylyltransferase